VTALVFALHTAALVALTIVGWRVGSGVLRSLDAMAGTLASIQRSLAEIDARLGALEAEPNGSDPHAHLMRDGRGQMRTM